MIPLEERCPYCGDELEDGCCDHCDDRWAANDNQEEEDWTA